MNWKGKKVMVTGSEGMIGKELVELLRKEKAIVFKFDYKNGPMWDLRNFDICMEGCQGMDYVFHLAGIKGSPKMTKEKPANFFVPMIQMNTNIMEAARRQNVKGFLYTSSIAVLNPQTDEYPAWAKKTGEMQLKAYNIQYPEFRSCIVRPANVYGRYDDFDNHNAMVITSLIAKGLKYDQIEIWGDGSEIRDFINSKDVAKGMIKTMEKMPLHPINLCSGTEITIKYIAEIISKAMGKKVYYAHNKKTGDEKRIMKSNGDLIDWKPEISIENGLKEVIEWKTR